VTSLFAAELLKLRTVRSTWGFVLVALALAALVTAGNIGAESQIGRLAPEYQFRIVLDAAFPAALLSLLLGMVLFTNEFRHGTIARTLLATPRRSRLLATKLLAGSAVGVALALVTLLVTVTMAIIWLRLLDVPLQHGEAADAAGRAVAGVVVAGVFGAALGGAVQSQVGALVGTLVWIFVVEPLCWALLALLDLDAVADYLPAASLAGIVDSNEEGLPFAGSLGMGVAWVAVATVLAFVRLRRRDIT
jgi:ABC-2 type transport system permease protein